MAKKITIIVGAGASKELGLPSGYELKQKIATLLDIRLNSRDQKKGDYYIYSALRLVAHQDAVPDINPFLQAARMIRDAMPQAMSIDNFIDSHQGNKKIELCGKLAIVRSILDADKRSKIFVDYNSGKSNINYTNTEDCWLTPFVRLVTENCRVGGLENRLNSVAFVIFNYDRCVEHYLYYALQNYYKIPEQQVADLLRNVQFFHPYGAVGTLPWQAMSHVAKFGEELEPVSLLENARQIKTFTEGTDPDSSEICAIREYVATADTILFLGFAFHKLNMRLLSGENRPIDDISDKRNFATAIGLSKSDCLAISREISHMRGCPQGSTELRNDLTCANIFSEYTRGISLA